MRFSTEKIEQKPSEDFLERKANNCKDKKKKPLILFWLIQIWNLSSRTLH